LPIAISLPAILLYSVAASSAGCLWLAIGVRVTVDAAVSTEPNGRVATPRAQLLNRTIQQTLNR